MNGSNMDDKTIRYNGFIYSPGTAAGFKRMQRLGIPRPAYRVENEITKKLKRIYKTLIKKMLSDFKKAAKARGGIVTDDDGDNEDTFENLIHFFEEMAKEAQEETENRIEVSDIADDLEGLWTDGMTLAGETIKNSLDTTLLDNQKDFMRKFSQDADDKITSIIKSFSIDKQQVFNANMDQLRTLYLDNSLERIAGEENYLKRMFLRHLNDYVTGKTATLDIEDIVDALADHSEHMARFFARDQMARFNKALTLATFKNAGVSKVKWITTHDVRVRDTHRKLDGQVFDIDNLPPEVDDYNCRCGLVPVAYYD